MGRAIDPFAFAQGKARPDDIKDELRDLPPAMTAAIRKDPVNGPSSEKNVALIQTMLGENSRAVSSLSQLLQTPCGSWITT
jgi:hypothetical protein